MDQSAIKRLAAFVATLSWLAVTSVPSAATAAGDYPPHRAGVKISLDGSFCTSGFGVADPVSGATYALTAGHCGAHGTVRMSGERVGSLLGSSFLCCDRTGADSALYEVPVEEQSATIANVLTTDGSLRGLLIGGLDDSLLSSTIPVVGYHANSSIHDGMKVCSAGAFGGLNCGRVYREDYSYRFGGGRILTGLVCARFAVRSGDSGGPIFSLSHGRARAVGIVSIGGGFDTCFTTIDDALGYWDMGLLVSDGDGFRIASRDDAETEAPERSLRSNLSPLQDRLRHLFGL